jgi:hypothetical protein
MYVLRGYRSKYLQKKFLWEKITPITRYLRQIFSKKELLYNTELFMSGEPN